MLGTCIGLAFHPRDGLCDVYQSLDTTELVVLVPRKGQGRRFMRRELVQWRPAPETSTQVAGSTPLAIPERPAQRNVDAQLALFELETP